MKSYKLIFIKLTFLIVGSLLVQCATQSKLTKGDLVFQEDFNDGQDIETASWSKIPRGTSDWNNFMSSEDTLYAIKDGNLILRGMKNTISKEDTASYITAGVYSKDKVFFGYGRWEIRAKLNAAKGAWPAFWLLPQDAPWPKGGEIDIMERLNFDDFVYQTVHSEYTYIDGIKDPQPSATMAINPTGYNTYAVEVHPDKIAFFVNGKLSHVYPKINGDTDRQFPFSNHQYYLLLDMQLGGEWVGEVKDEDLPVEMQIDWVKFYSFDALYQKD